MRMVYYEPAICIFSGWRSTYQNRCVYGVATRFLCDIRTSADELADLTVGMNVLFIQGAVVVNESRYDEERTIAGWDQELKDADKIGSLSASLFDGGFDGLKQNYSQQRGENPLPLIPSANPANDLQRILMIYLRLAE